MKKPCVALVRAANYWRNALRLNDWDLSLREAKPGELEAQNENASVCFMAPLRSAEIVLRSLTRFDAELEKDLVHELLHLVFVQLSMFAGQGRDLDRLMMEQGIEAVADRLVVLRRVRAAAKFTYISRE